MTGQFSGVTHAVSGGGAMAIAALQSVTSGSPPQSQLSSSADSSRSSDVKDASLRTVQEDLVLSDLVVAPFARRGRSDSMLMSRPSPAAADRSTITSDLSGSDSYEKSEQCYVAAVGFPRSAPSGFQFPSQPTAAKSRVAEEALPPRHAFSDTFGGSYMGTSSVPSRFSYEALSKIGMMATTAPADGFVPSLGRCRTFTAADHERSSSPFQIASKSGWVPMSTSEGNMLALLARHPRGEGATHSPMVLPPRVSVEGTRPMDWRNSNGDALNRNGATGIGSAPRSACTWCETADGAATSRMPRDTCVMRLHKASLVEDACRRVMDLVEGRAVSSGGEGLTTAGRQAAQKVTLKEVQAHFQSLPLRYSLTVEPAEVTVHMQLAAEAAQPSAAPRVLVSPHFGGTASLSCDGGGGRRRRCSVVVVCRSSPSVLLALASSVKSAAGTCTDVDMMNTSSGISLARLEVEGDWPSVSTFRSSSEGNESHAATSPDSTTTAHPLAGILSCGVARAIAIDEAKPGESRGRQDDCHFPYHHHAFFGSSGVGSAPHGSSIRAAAEGRGNVEEEADIHIFSRDLLAAPAKKVRAATSAVAAGNANGGFSETPKFSSNRFPSSAGFGGRCSPSNKPQESPQPQEGSTTASPIAAATPRAPSSGPSPSVAVPNAVVRLATGVGESVGDGVDGTGAEMTPRQQPLSPYASSDRTGADGRGGRRRARGGLVRRAGCQFPLPTAADAPTQSPRHQRQYTQYAFSGDSKMYDDYIAPEDIEVLDLVGQGRFSRTYRARWQGKTVAVKTVEMPGKPSAEEGAGAGAGDAAGTWELGPHSEGRLIMTEFERELHVVRRLDHPHLCGYLGVCIAAPQFSLVYKFYEHGSLADRLRNKGTGNPSPLGAGAGKAAASGVCIGGSGGNGGSGTALAPLGSAELFTVGQDVAEGMRYLHQVGVLHRDLKSDNILLDSSDRAQIADFGLSCFCNPMREHTAETGTYRWMAPEVIRHERYCEGADVYSFGVVLWEILTRQLPFESLTPIQAAFAVARHGLRPQLPPEAPPALSALIARCWDQNPGARPSFAQICEELPDVKIEVLGSTGSGDRNAGNVTQS